MRAALIAGTLILALAAIAHATPADDLDHAREAYRDGQYNVALPLYNALLYPPPPRLASPRELTAAYLALGVCRFETGDPAGAKREFAQALALDPTSSLDPMIVTDAAAIAAFEAARADMRERETAEAEAKHRAELRQLRNSMIGVEPHSLVVALLPFGLGQFQNNENLKGTLFAAAQGTTFAASLSIWYYLVNEYGIRSTHVPLADGPRVRHLQQAEIGTGVAFLGLWLWSAIDAYRHYKASTEVELDESMLPPELRELDKPRARPKRQPPKPTSLLDHVIPIITPGGGGIGIVWENL